MRLKGRSQKLQSPHPCKCVRKNSFCYALNLWPTYTALKIALKITPCDIQLINLEKHPLKKPRLTWLFHATIRTYLRLFMLWVVSHHADLDIYLHGQRMMFRTLHQTQETAPEQRLRWHKFLLVNWWCLKTLT